MGTRVEMQRDGHFKIAEDQGQPGDFGKACFAIFAGLIALAAAWTAAKWAVEQAWIGYAIEWAIGIPVALFVLFAVVTGIAKR